MERGKSWLMVNWRVADSTESGVGLPRKLALGWGKVQKIILL